MPHAIPIKHIARNARLTPVTPIACASCPPVVGGGCIRINTVQFHVALGRLANAEFGKAFVQAFQEQARLANFHARNVAAALALGGRGHLFFDITLKLQVFT